VLENVVDLPFVGVTDQRAQFRLAFGERNRPDQALDQKRILRAFPISCGQFKQVGPSGNGAVFQRTVEGWILSLMSFDLDRLPCSSRGTISAAFTARSRRQRLRRGS
jgi:hypothetical protein